ncbi:MAG: hypothetical protein KDB29_00570, partial [Planctomycetes bacterium]|nr:hypothetical protein [Planctomycetota bacterium]
ESIESGGVTLSGYQVVDWVLGNESTADETFSSTEQGLVSSYLGAGGRLFVSGAEIGWDLDSQGSGADVSFYEGQLETNYVADDSADYSVDPVTGGLFDGLAGFDFDDGSGDSYTVGYPDIIEPSSSGSAAPALQYSAGVFAATASDAVVVFGFPFETINQSSARDAVMERVLRSLAASYTGINTSMGGGGGSGSGGGGDDSGCSVDATGAFPLALAALALFWWRRRKAFSQHES